MRTAVYRLFDKDDNLLYVGISNNPVKRWINHSHTKNWWHLVERREVNWHERRPEAEAEERLAVQVEKPRFDATHRLGGGWRNTPRVTYVDPREHEVTTAVRAAIAGGVFPHGRALPPGTRLAAQFKTSTQAMSKALSVLQESGEIDRRYGRWFLPGEAPEPRQSCCNRADQTPMRDDDC